MTGHAFLKSSSYTNHQGVSKMVKKLINNIDRRIESFTSQRWSVILFFTSLCLAVLFSFALFPLLGETTSGLDPDGYGETGKILYETGRFQSITKAPLYPVFIALLSWLIDGYQIWIFQLAQCILFSLTSIVLYAIFQRTLSPKNAKYAGLLCSVYPMSIWYIPRLWTETFLTLMIALLTLALINLLQKQTITNTLLCSLLVALTALTKGIAIVFIPLTLLVLLIRFRSKSFFTVVLFAVVGFALVAPWTWRNRQLTGRFMPIHATGGYNFYLGNGFSKYWLEAPFSYVELKDKTEEDMQGVQESTGFDLDDPLSIDDALMQAAVADIKHNPVLFIKKILVQSLTFWYLAASTSKSLFTGFLQIPIVLLAIPGFVRAVRFRSWALCLLIPITGIMGAAVLIFSFGRLSATIMPYMIGIVVYGLSPMLYPIPINSTHPR